MMHYYIDGYNMLFRIMHQAGGNLQQQRTAIIQDINKKAALLKLNISIVFDATFQIGEGSRGHFDQLEILFTSQGETADEYILEELNRSSLPSQETVITSDKNLARKARSQGAQAETIEDFLLRLNKSYKKKQWKRPLPAKPPTPLAATQPPKTAPPKDAPLQAYTEYYAHIFEQEWEKNMAVEESRRVEQKKRPPRKPKQKVDPFKTAPPPEPDSIDAMERWLKIFEKRLSE